MSGQWPHPYLSRRIAPDGFVLQPHKDVPIFFGLYLEDFIIFQSNCFHICLKREKGRKQGRMGGPEGGREEGKEEKETGNIMIWAGTRWDVILKPGGVAQGKLSE